MPRTSRTVAQRLATGPKARKRRPQRPVERTAPAAVEQILDEAAPQPTATSTIPAPVVGRRVASATRAAPPRRRYADYGEEYRYVASDFRRIALVAGGLLFLLLLLATVIR